MGTTLPWTPEATGILASVRMVLHQSERLQPFLWYLVSQSQDSGLSLYGRGFVFHSEKL